MVSLSNTRVLARWLSAALLAVALAVPMPAANAEPQPVAPPDFVAIEDVDPTILQDIRSSHRTTSPATRWTATRRRCVC